MKDTINIPAVDFATDDEDLRDFLQWACELYLTQQARRATLKKILACTSVEIAVLQDGPYDFTAQIEEQCLTTRFNETFMQLQQVEYSLQAIEPLYLAWNEGGTICSDGHMMKVMLDSYYSHLHHEQRQHQQQRARRNRRK